MPRNRIPRRRDGRRNWHKLDRHERAILAALYAAADPWGLTYTELCDRTGLSGPQVRRALNTLTDPRRGRPLGSRAAVLEYAQDAELARGVVRPVLRYRCTDAWTRAKRTA